MSYTTVMMEPRHRPMVRTLWQENLQGIGASPRAEERLGWLYDRSPDGPAQTVLVMHKDDPTPVACGTVLPRRIRMNDGEVVAGIPIDFVVAKKHRIGAAALMLQRKLASFVDEGKFSFLIGYPNKLALGVFMRIGYKKIGEANAWIKPLRAGYKLKKYLKSDLLTAAAALPANAMMAAIDRVRCHCRIDVRRETTKTADARFDGLWAEAAAKFPITTARNFAYLNWRYAEFTTMEYRMFCVSDAASGKLVGYVAYSADGPKVAVADLFAADPEMAFTAVLPAFCRQMRREGADSVFVGVMGSPAVDQHLKRLGFFRRTENPRSLVFYGGSGNRYDAALDPANWYATDGEVDI